MDVAVGAGLDPPGRRRRGVWAWAIRLLRHGVVGGVACGCHQPGGSRPAPTTTAIREPLRWSRAKYDAGQV